MVWRTDEVFRGKTVLIRIPRSSWDPKKRMEIATEPRRTYRERLTPRPQGQYIGLNAEWAVAATMWAFVTWSRRWFVSSDPTSSETGILFFHYRIERKTAEGFLHMSAVRFRPRLHINWWQADGFNCVAFELRLSHLSSDNSLHPRVHSLAFDSAEIHASGTHSLIPRGITKLDVGLHWSSGSVTGYGAKGFVTRGIVTYKGDMQLHTSSLSSMPHLWTAIGPSRRCMRADRPGDIVKVHAPRQIEQVFD